MILRPADESRVFHDEQTRLAQQKVVSWHPQWASRFHAAHSATRPVVSGALERASGKGGKIFTAVVASIAVLIVGSLGGVKAYYHDRVLPGVGLDNVSLAGKTPSQAKADLSAYAGQYSLSVEGGAVTKQPTPQQIGLTFDINATLDNMLKQGKSGLGVPFLSTGRPDFVVKLDQAKFDQYVASVNQVNVAPVNAELDIKNGAVTITPEKDGTVYGINPVQAVPAVLAAASSGQPAKLQVQHFSSRPTVTTATLTQDKQVAEQMINTPVKLQIAGHQITTTPTQISSWMKVSATKSGAKVEVDPILVAAYLDAAAKPYVQPPRAKVVVKAADGTETVLSDGAAGVDLVDKDTSANEIAAAVDAHKGYDKALGVSYAAPKTITAADYAKWIDVDITNKRMYAYEHGTVVRQFLVTAGAPLTPTVTGQFAIQSKYRVQNMQGFNADGTRYFQPDVEYINYFYQDYAIHGNYWRPLSAFGNVNTSHGCVGIVNSDAKWMYDWAPIGTPVIVHT